MAFLVYPIGFAPLAARPAEQLLIVRFAYISLVTHNFVGKTLTLVRGSPLESNRCRVKIYQKATPKKEWLFGVPDWIRTNGTKRRRLVLYPAELRIHDILLSIGLSLDIKGHIFCPYKTSWGSLRFKFLIFHLFL